MAPMEMTGLACSGYVLCAFSWRLKAVYIRIRHFQVKLRANLVETQYTDDNVCLNIHVYIEEVLFGNVHFYLTLAKRKLSRGQFVRFPVCFKATIVMRLTGVCNTVNKRTTMVRLPGNIPVCKFSPHRTGLL